MTAPTLVKQPGLQEVWMDTMNTLFPMNVCSSVLEVAPSQSGLIFDKALAGFADARLNF